MQLSKLCNQYLVSRFGGAQDMVRLRVLDILKEQHRSKYWLCKQMDISYQNLNRMLNNQTSSIRFENLDRLCTILNCDVGDLFEKNDDDSSPRS